MSIGYSLVAVDNIRESPYQTRKRFEGIEGLAESIKAHGLMNPVTVRFKPECLGNGSYELIAGERRWRAWMLTQEGVAFNQRKPIPAMVVEVDDRTAAELVVTENMQREQLGPLEEAAGVAALLGLGHSAEEVGERLGRTGKWVRRRAKLLELIPELQEAVGDADSKWSMAPVAGLELIAALPLKVQRELYGVDWWYGVTLGEVRRRIEEQMRDLAKAPFSVFDCGGCTKRTGVAPDLFEGVDSCELGRCLDVKCWRQKEVVAVKCLLNEKLREEPGVKIFAEGYSDQKEYELNGVPWQAEKREKDAGEGAVAAYKLVDRKLVKVWLPKKEAEKGQVGPTVVEKAMAAELRRMEAWVRGEGAADRDGGGHDNEGDGLAELLKGKTTCDLLKLVLMFGCDMAYGVLLDDGCYSITDEERWGKLLVADEADPNAAVYNDRLAEMIADGIRGSVRSAVGFERVTGCGGKYREALYIDRVVLGANVMEALDTEVQGHDRDGGVNATAATGYGEEVGNE